MTNVTVALAAVFFFKFILKWIT